MFKSKQAIFIGIVAVLAVAGAALALGWFGGAGIPGEGSAPSARALESAPAGSARFEVVSSSSEARYRVREQFVNVSFPVDAVGTTRSIEGSVVFDASGRVVAGASSIRVNVSTLRSDQSRRDNFLRNASLETQRYPYVTFTPVEVRGLPSPVPAEGNAEITIVGDLTVRNVTRRVEWTGTAQFRPDGMHVDAGVVITFDQFEMEKPRVAMILSVADEIRLEAAIDFRRVS